MRGVGKIQSLKIHSQSLAQARSVIVWVCARSDHLPYVACAHVACIHCLRLLIVSLVGLLISLGGLLKGAAILTLVGWRGCSVHLRLYYNDAVKNC